MERLEIIKTKQFQLDTASMILQEVCRSFGLAVTAEMVAIEGKLT